MISSESLGSKILRDALLCQEDLNTSKAKALVFESRLIFLFSNQIPLLNIGNAEACNTRQIESKMRAMEQLKTVVPSEEPALPILTGGFSDIFKVFEMQPKEKSPLFDFYPLMDKSKFPDERPRFTIVSFTDPNDILSYEVDKGEYEDNTVVNVVVSNDYTYFGKFENPDKAHRGYGDNKVVLKTLKCGFNNSHVEECLEN